MSLNPLATSITTSPVVQGADGRSRFLSDLPQTEDEKLVALLDDVRNRAELYDDLTLTPAFEARNVNRPGIHAVNKGRMRLFSANLDFPWRVPAGTEDSPNASRWFARIPPTSGKPVVVRHERPMASDGKTRLDRNNYWSWYFPVGTTFVEFARVHDAQDTPYVFQVNQLALTSSGWQPTIYRSEIIADANGLIDRFGDDASGEILSLDIADKKHPRRQTFDTHGMLFSMPALEASVLKESKFVAAPATWDSVGGETIAGVTTDDFSLVPKNFTGCLIGVSQQSCTRCHQDAGRHVNEFDAFGSQGDGDSGRVGARHWYGKLRGSDRILSWHPFAESSISTSGANNPVVFRADIVEVFDASKHSRVDYPGLSQ